MSTYAVEKAEREREHARRAAKFRFVPVGIDAWDARSSTPARGAVVVKIRPPFGCPNPRPMGMVYVADATSGRFIGLVLLASLVRCVGGEVCDGS